MNNIVKIICIFNGKNVDETVVTAKKTYNFNDTGYLGDKIKRLEVIGEKWDDLVIEGKGFDAITDEYKESFNYEGKELSSIEALIDHITEIHRS